MRMIKRTNPGEEEVRNGDLYSQEVHMNECLFCRCLDLCQCYQLEGVKQVIVSQFTLPDF